MPFFDDDGNELDPSTALKPELCKNCKKNGYPNEFVLCTLTRFGQSDEEEFICHGFEQIILN